MLFVFIKFQPSLGSFEAALAAAAAGATHRKKENAPPPKKVKEEYSDDDDIPWAERMAREKNGKSSEKKKDKKRKASSDSEDEYKPEDSDEEDDIPWSERIKRESLSPSASKKPKVEVDSDYEEVNLKKEKKRRKKDYSDSDDDYAKPKNDKKKKKKEKEAKDKKAWKEEKKPAGVKWNSLHHKGPLFAPAYVRLPDHVKFKYDGKVVVLSDEAEEVATFYARMLGHEYTTKDSFNKNFFHDWRKVMTPQERELITDLKKCDFRQMDVYFKEQSEIRKAMSKEEKQKIKEAKEAEAKIYGVAIIDGHKQKVGNFRIEPPGLFRGRGGHPKMGMLKKRIRPEDVIINCSKDSEIPVPPEGHKWKEVRHDNTVTWLVSWTENVLGQNKYIMLNPSSKIKASLFFFRLFPSCLMSGFSIQGEKDYEKYETARRLKNRIDDIRAVYQADWKSKEMRVRQRAVALYFIDKLALRAGNEKDVDEAADTVGCCSLRCEHIKLYEKLDDKEYVVEFDFLGKDSIRYFNQVPVEKRVFKNLQLFMDNKEPGDDLFDRLDTASLNEHLRSLMDGLTVKVFRTYNASITLQQQLAKLTRAEDNVHQKMLSYNRANRMVAILCNHQRAVPKGHEKAMGNLEQKIKDKKQELKEAKAELEKARGAAKEKAQKKVDRLKEQLKKLKIARTDRDENKQIALSTSKLNYLDPRISVAWCKKFDVPIEKVFNKTLREKFRWAIDMTMSSDEEYIF
ncbi:Eukaryotic DNA topoisomerase I, DNA binding protein [Ancylostoma caninum]|uniref:DNA topoisomerase I n=1 Tax=Ancylostoma caninum TaxID=29170 RepID=A0A368GDS3_ANCCA|nr:Eukaryotic DNA topoisomerase I, DNA binding protein [Ancylostoma caninum]